MPNSWSVFACTVFGKCSRSVFVAVLSEYMIMYRKRSSIVYPDPIFAHDSGSKVCFNPSIPFVTGTTLPRSVGYDSDIFR